MIFQPKAIQRGGQGVLGGIGRRAADFPTPDASVPVADDDEEVIGSGHALLNREEPVTDRFGNRRWHSTTKVPLRNSEGRIIGLVVML